MIEIKAMKVFEVMMKRGLMPTKGSFQVTEEMLEHSYNIYREVHGFDPTKRMSNAEVKFSKRLAGLNMMKLSMSRTDDIPNGALKSNKVRCGFVYMVSNPAFPGIFKVGMTTNLNKRLSTYQTGDPYRSYKVENYRFVEDRKLIEDSLLKEFSLDVVKGEWVKSEKASEIFLKVSQGY